MSVTDQPVGRARTRPARNRPSVHLGARTVRKLSVLLTTLLAGVLLPLGAPTAGAADNGSWSVFPATADAGSRPYFYLSADPGATLTDKVTVTNKTGEPLTFRLYAADAYNTARDGGFAVRGQKEKQRSVGAWAKAGRDRVTVKPHGSVTVPVRIEVPEDAEPGDHPGALVALDERIDPADAGAVAVGIRKAVGARIYLRVNGPTMPALSVEDVEVEHTAPWSRARASPGPSSRTRSATGATSPSVPRSPSRPRASSAAPCSTATSSASPRSCCPARRSGSPRSGRARRRWSGARSS